MNVFQKLALDGNLTPESIRTAAEEARYVPFQTVWWDPGATHDGVTQPNPLIVELVGYPMLEGATGVTVFARGIVGDPTSAGWIDATLLGDVFDDTIPLDEMPEETEPAEPDMNADNYNRGDAAYRAEMRDAGRGHLLP